MSAAPQVRSGDPRRRWLGPSRGSARRSPARLDHPGVVGVFDAGEDGNRRYLVLRARAGETLDR